MMICKHCNTQMAEGFGIGSNGLRITNKGMINSEPVAELKCAVCPECGSAELYVEDPGKIKALMIKE